MNRPTLPLWGANERMKLCGFFPAMTHDDNVQAAYQICRFHRGGVRRFQRTILSIKESKKSPISSGKTMDTM